MLYRTVAGAAVSKHGAQPRVRGDADRAVCLPPAPLPPPLGRAVCRPADGLPLRVLQAGRLLVGAGGPRPASGPLSRAVTIPPRLSAVLLHGGVDSLPLRGPPRAVHALPHEAGEHGRARRHPPRPRLLRGEPVHRFAVDHRRRRRLARGGAPPAGQRRVPGHVALLGCPRRARRVPGQGEDLLRQAGLLRPPTHRQHLHLLF
mmetsp:Transcript_21857/g.85614  ORF Transcript_21857/g.85614 Transcript_21857/m.85614 type:complete len:203 (-) Transcript_21857:74-682(-)